MEDEKKTKKKVILKKPKKEIIVDSSASIKDIYELTEDLKNLKISDDVPIVEEKKHRKGCPQCGFVKETKPKTKRARKCIICACNYESSPQEHRESPRHLAISLLISKIADSDEKKIVQMMDKI